MIVICTAATYQTRDFYFGRTLDYEHSFGEEIAVTPRNFPFKFRETGEISSHYAIIGMARVMDGYPLYFDAANEKGLCAAGLNFVGNARYFSNQSDRDNIAQFELIPWLLCRCANLDEAKKLLSKINITGAPFREDIPPSQLHWMVSDSSGSITVETMADGLHIHENPVGVLTNNPPFDQQLFNLNHYRHLRPDDTENLSREKADSGSYSRGMGAIGLPGDYSSQSRFVRAAFVKTHSRSDASESASVNQFFHIMNSVNVPRGCVRLEDGSDDVTIYTSCINADRGIYYYTCYNNHQICAVDMHRENLDGKNLIRCPLAKDEQIYMLN